MSMKKTPTGFTLLETLVAVSILAFAIAGPLVTASRALVAAEISRDQLTASYLAQEGIEYVRAIRDNAYLALYPNVSNAWPNFISGIESICLAPSLCTLDPVLRTMGYGNGFAVATYGGNAPLYLTASPSVYTEQNLAGSTQTPFTRTVQAVRVSATEERIVSTVSWSFHGTSYSVTTSDHLTPWQ